jgi:hypothetical protein
VGHSHGGNVAFRAIEHLNDDTHGIYLVTLATPFLEIFSRERKSVSRQKLAFVSLVGFLDFQIITLLLLILLTGPQGLTHSFSVTVGSLTAVAVLLSLLVALAYSRDASGFGTRSSQATPAELVDKLAEASSHEAFTRSNIPLLVIRGADDEASLGIASAAISSRLSTLLSATLHWALGVFFSVFGMVFYGKLLIFLVKGVFAGWSWSFPIPHTIIDDLFNVSVSLFTLLAILSIVSTLFSLSFGYAFGREFFMRFVDADISVNSTPDTPRKTTVYTIVRRTWATKRLRHYLYDDLSVPSIIVDWLLSETNGYELMFFDDDSRRKHPALQAENEAGHQEIPDVDEVRRPEHAGSKQRSTSVIADQQTRVAMRCFDNKTAYPRSLV